MCNCNESALMLTVRKEGPNTGRAFYKCSKPQGQGCDFFLWADSMPTTPTAQSPGARNTNFRHPPAAAAAATFQDSPGSVTQCGCQEPAKLLTVQKAGLNQGRQFYACSKPRESQCNFFQWATESTGTGTSEESNRFGGSFNPSSTRGRGRGGARGGAARGRSTESNGETKKRKCGVCGQEGTNIGAGRELNRLVHLINM